MLVLLINFKFNHHFFLTQLQPDDSLEDSREATPDSDSGYVVSTAVANNNSFKNSEQAAVAQAKAVDPKVQYVPDVSRRRASDQQQQNIQPQRPVAKQVYIKYPFPGISHYFQSL